MSELEALREQTQSLESDLEQDLESLTAPETLEAFRIEFLSRKGRLAQLFKTLAALPAADRAEAGQLLNALKERATAALVERRRILEKVALDESVLSQRADLSLPGVYHRVGHLHLLTQVQQEIESIFLRLGFDVASGPEMETEYYNFEALNIPAHHPAREEWDSFYLEDGRLLRAHTSPVQIRVMERTSPPVRIVCPGRCYRRDSQDATHSPVFHQIELLWVEEGLSLSNLKYVIELFVHAFFGEGYDMRLSGDFFPFTEPSVQVHMRPRGSTRWLELGGAGMVNPAVLAGVGYDTERLTGFAFGFGLERMAMLRHRIDDIRTFLANDLRFITQF